jgi:sorting nexin-8
LAQSSESEDLSIEELSSSLPNLPLPQITVPSPSPSGFAMDSPSAETSTSPWDTAPRVNGNGNGNGNGGGHYVEPSDMTTTTNADERPGAFSVGSERGYWKRLETVEVGLLAEREGWFLQKYKVESDVRRDARCRAGLINRNEVPERYQDGTRILSGYWIA